MTAVAEGAVTAAPAAAAPAAAAPVAMRPAWYVVAGRKQETCDTVTLLLRPAGSPIQAPRPGQFTMLYAFGVGEIPVSVSGIGQDGVWSRRSARSGRPPARCAPRRPVR